MSMEDTKFYHIGPLKYEDCGEVNGAWCGTCGHGGLVKLQYDSRGTQEEIVANSMKVSAFANDRILYCTNCQAHHYVPPNLGWWGRGVIEAEGLAKLLRESAK
jgi:hypothetical protein